MTQTSKKTYSSRKTTAIKEFEQLLKEYPIVGAVDMESLPAPQLQQMREQLRGTCVIKMTKRRLMSVAIQNTTDDKPGIDELEEHLKGMPALLFTKENPFTLFKILKKNKSPAPAKGGQTAPKDIKISAGPTPFAPGPIIGELGKFGLKSGVENGKVAIKQDKIVCKEGEEISPELAALLTRLDIKPMEVGLALTAVYEEGEILTKHVLDIDEEQYLADLTSAAAGALNLAVNAAIPNEQSIQLLLGKASREARNLSRESAHLTDETTEEILGYAQSHVHAITSHLPDEALSEELRASAKQAAAAPAPKQEQPEADKSEPEEEDDEDAEGDAAAGMGALFG